MAGNQDSEADRKGISMGDPRVIGP